jgi:hypothetical protein
MGPGSGICIGTTFSQSRLAGGKSGISPDIKSKVAISSFEIWLFSDSGSVEIVGAGFSIVTVGKRIVVELSIEDTMSLCFDLFFADVEIVAGAGVDDMLTLEYTVEEEQEVAADDNDDDNVVDERIILLAVADNMMSGIADVAVEQVDEVATVTVSVEVVIEETGERGCLCGDSGSTS